VSLNAQVYDCDITNISYVLADIYFGYGNNVLFLMSDDGLYIIL